MIVAGRPPCIARLIGIIPRLLLVFFFVNFPLCLARLLVATPEAEFAAALLRSLAFSFQLFTSLLNFIDELALALAMVLRVWFLDFRELLALHRPAAL